MPTLLGGGPKRELIREFASSPRAAGELLDVLGEGLGGQLEAFDHCQVGKELVGEIVHGHPRAQRESRGLDRLAPLRRENLGAEQAAAPGFGDQLDEASRVDVDKRSRHVSRWNPPGS